MPEARGGVLIATIPAMTRTSLTLGALCALFAAGCNRTAPAEAVIPPAAQAPAPARLSQPDVTDPPAPAPTARGTYASMTPPFMQHTPPRPRTRSATTRPDSSIATPVLTP